MIRKVFLHTLFYIKLQSWAAFTLLSILWWFPALSFLSSKFSSLCWFERNKNNVKRKKKTISKIVRTSVPKHFIIMDDLISNFEIIMLIVFGMLVPTGDNYSDIWLSYTYFSGTYVPAGKFIYIWNETLSMAEKVPIVPIQQPIYGLMTLLPVLVSFLITTIHWYQTEKSPNRCWTLPLLLTQIWPQYRTARILWLYKKGDSRWKNEKEQVEKQLSAIGKFVWLFTQ